MRPIKMDETAIERLIGKFRASLNNEIITGETVSFKENLSEKATEEVVVNFTNLAYQKMMALVNHFSSEIAWNGTVERTSENHYEITDIFVYPQTVSGVTVNTDQAEFNKWVAELPDEIFNKRRFQAHSHVDMGVSPSGQDISDQNRLISSLTSAEYYIIAIWNKKESYSIWVYDLVKNVVYDTKDVTVTVDGYDLSGFLEDAEKMLKKPLPVIPVSTATAAAATKGKSKKHSKFYDDDYFGDKVTGAYPWNENNHYYEH